MVYQSALLVVAIIFIIIGAILFLAPIPQPPYLAVIVLAIGLGLLVLWAVLYGLSAARVR